MVKNNGSVSKKINMNRGIRQGCQLSALLFIIAVEILGIEIRNNENVKGFMFGDTEFKISQYADDCTILVSDVNSIQNAMQTIKKFSLVSGPQLNMDKVQGAWLGALKERMPTTFAGITWTSSPIKCLGVYLGHDKMQCKVLNWDNKIVKIKNLFSQWSRRKLSLFGKVVVIKALILPVVIHCASVIRAPQNFVKELKREINNFIDIKRKDLQKSFNWKGTKWRYWLA